MVMKTSAVRTASSVSGLGNAAERSRPNFGHRRHHHRVDFLGRSRARGAGLHPSGGVVSEQGRGHLGAAGVVHTDKQNVFAEFGDATNRYTDAKARRNYAETITRASGKNPGLVPLRGNVSPTYSFTALTALTASPDAHAFYDSLRARDIDHNDALRSYLTASLESCTAACGTAPSTTRPPLGPPPTKINTKPLDNLRPWDV